MEEVTRLVTNYPASTGAVLSILMAGVSGLLSMVLPLFARDNKALADSVTETGRGGAIIFAVLAFVLFLGIGMGQSMAAKH
jgi:hypothetical protein